MFIRKLRAVSRDTALSIMFFIIVFLVVWNKNGNFAQLMICYLTNLQIKTDEYN